MTDQPHLEPLRLAQNMNVPPAVAVEQMRQNCRRDLPWFEPVPTPHEGVLVIVGGGPSVKTRADVLAGRRKARETIATVNGGLGWLREQGIEPDIVCLMDASPAVLGFLPEPEEPDEIEWLCASMVHPSVLDQLEDKQVTLWHADINQPEQSQILRLEIIKPWALIGGGNTAALRMLNLGYLLGFRKFHLYGMDSSYPEGEADHAYPKHDGVEPPPKMITYGERTYCCSGWMARQAEEFRSLVYPQLRALGCELRAHGDGLLPDICRTLNRMVRPSPTKLLVPRGMS